MGGVCMKQRLRSYKEDPAVLAAQTYFDVSEVEILYELFKKLSSSIVDDKQRKQNLFSDRIFQLFDLKQDRVIEFEFKEFVRCLIVFHPEAPQAEKAAFMNFLSIFNLFFCIVTKYCTKFAILDVVVAFQPYDLQQTGFIEHEEVKEMILTFLKESDLILRDEIVEAIIVKTFEEADSKRDGKIGMEEWRELMAQNPSLLKNITISCLRGIALHFPVLCRDQTLKTSRTSQTLKVEKESQESYIALPKVRNCKKVKKVSHSDIKFYVPLI